ncbi:ERCC4 domain-containing protein [Rostrohypoxylon terebratum]|nr:ERCC4 domain-containing protein [Rostrohypoxylon terebratum]
MAAEVIILPSSPASATGPPPPSVPGNAASSGTSLKPPSRALDYGTIDSDTESISDVNNRPPGKVTHDPLFGLKCAGSHTSRHGDDFMFLSDDFDITGGLDGDSVQKPVQKPRSSTSTASIKKKDEYTLKRTSSAAFAAKNSKPHSSNPNGSRWNWNAIDDPIEHSSSPNRLVPSKVPTRRGDPLDPFASSPMKQIENTKSSRLDLTSDPFRSSPVREVNVRSPPKGITCKQSSPKGKGPAKGPVVIDLSDDDSDHVPAKYQSKKSKKNGAWDPISSSMPEAKTNIVHISDSNSDSNSDSDALPDLADLDFSKPKSSKRFYSLTPSPPRKRPKVVVAAAAKPTTKGPTAKKTAEPKKSNEEKEYEKQKKAEAREAEKERKRIEKEQAKEQKAVEKQKEKALAEVNKLKTDRKAAVPEMIVDLPESLSVGIKAQIEELLRKIDVQFEYQQSSLDNVVKWRRKVASKYNEDLGHWEPIPMRIMPEAHVLVILEAADFVKLVLGAEDQSLEAHVLKMKTTHPDNILLYLIQGLVPWMRKNKNIQNRRFASAVRALDANDVAPSSSQRRRKNAAQQEYIDEDMIEDALLSLQVAHGAMIHHTDIQVQTAEWVAVFTQHISTIPYRKARDAAADAGFCMEAGQVRTGEDAKDTYVRMLQEVTRVTAPIAYGIAAKYGTVAELVRGLETEGPLAIENCKKCANKDGAFTDRVIGPAISKRIWKIFTSRDPGNMDV